MEQGSGRQGGDEERDRRKGDRERQGNNKEGYKETESKEVG